MSQTEIDIERYKELVIQKQGEHRRFLSQLKMKLPSLSLISST